MEVDLIEVGRQRPLIAVLGALRGLPDREHGVLDLWSVVSWM